MECFIMVIKYLRTSPHNHQHRNVPLSIPLLSMYDFISFMLLLCTLMSSLELGKVLPHFSENDLNLK